MNTIANTPVAIGDKIIPLPQGNDGWYGLPEWYRDKVGTVTNIWADYVDAEFASQMKPDDTVSYAIARWRKRPALGDTVRFIGDSYTEIFGKIGTVETDDTTALPFWVTGLYAERASRGLWCTEAQVEVVQDGETLTVSGPFREGETLYVTGRDDSYNGIEVVYVKQDNAAVDRHEVKRERGLLYFFAHQLTREVPAAAQEPEEPEIVKELRFQLERANERVDEATTRAGKWERDFLRSWQRVGQEATERQWCSEYERVVSDVQGELEIGTIPPRVTLVEKRIRITGTVWRDVTVWVPENEYATDSDNWYDSNDLDDHCSEDFLIDSLNGKYENSGFDETDVEVLR